MQGGKFGPLQCSNSTDKVGKSAFQQGKHLYLYKEMVPILPLTMVDDLLGIANCGQESLSLNTYLNAKFELKKLRFHTPDEKGKSKCHIIHVGKESSLCPKLQVHGETMEKVNEDIYLGDCISGVGSNKKSIEMRKSRGMNTICEIMNILDNISFGEHYFSTALVLRESLFLSSILTNTEVWVGLTNKNIKEFEDLDMKLLRKILRTHFSVPSEAVRLELGLLDIDTMIKSRRLNFFRYLVGQSENTMLYKFFLCQLMYPCQDDWTIQVKQDLIDFNFSCQIEDIKSISRQKAKNTVSKSTLN